MNPANINQAMVNRANAQYEIKAINNRISDLANRINGVDVVFRQNELISGNVLSDVLKGLGPDIEWLSAALISNATVYEAPAPAQSSYINSLRPASMWKAHITANDVYADAYTPLETFVRESDNTISFSPLQMPLTSNELKNYGGNLPNAILPLLNTTPDQTALQSMILNIESSEYLNINNLYYIQNTDLISENLGGAHAESFTLHFE